MMEAFAMLAAIDCPPPPHSHSNTATDWEGDKSVFIFSTGLKGTF